MSNLGKITNAFLNATNETTVALANLNFDFAILKYEAPKEFQVVGTSLSSRRRNEAEDGKSHRIASRLGALFGSIVPATPNLINAYGSRASQIATSPTANPKQNPRYGPFAEFVGIDGTSLWAAATSAQSKAGTHAPLAMYLLACMLARRWDSSVAVSIWVEIVEQRQKEIEASLQDQPQHISLFMAAKHEITRDDLACWDASARAWLQSADEVKCVERTKFDLIAKNISIDIGCNQRMYHDVIEVWKCAMQGMELLVQGTPQELSDGAILLALSAWHIYPDLIVLGKTTRKVSFQDPLVSSGGVITVGLQYAHDEREPGMHWSLTLSQLFYYNEGTKVHARTDTSRVSMKELLVIAFGTFMSSWNIPRRDEIAAAEFLVELCNRFLGKGSYDLPWLRIFALASQEFLNLKHADEPLCTELMSWSRRRAKNWLLGKVSPPLFGLTDPCISAGLRAADGHEAAFHYFRKLASILGTKEKTYIIRYREQRAGTVYFEFATVTPHVKRSNKCGLDGSLKSEECHQRWLYLTGHPNRLRNRCYCTLCGTSCPCRKQKGSLCSDDCHPTGSQECQELAAHRLSSSVGPKSRCYCNSCGASCPCRKQKGSLCSDDCHPAGSQECQGLAEIDKSRTTSLEQLGEESQWISHRDMYESSNLDSFRWRNPPAMLRENTSTSGEVSQTCPSLRDDFKRCTCADPLFQPKTEGVNNLVFEVVEGNPETYCLFAASRVTSLIPDATEQDGPRYQKRSEAASDRVRISDLRSAISTLKGGSINNDLLQEYMHDYESRSTDISITQSNAYRIYNRRTLAGISVLCKQRGVMGRAQRTSLKALDAAQEIYEHLQGAFIPLSVTEKSLSSATWLDDKDVGNTMIVPPTNRPDQTSVNAWPNPLDYHSTRHLTARCFACIVWFESGIYSVSANECKPVIAMASGNSIFVASYLMSDPGSDSTSKGLVQRITGNVGMAGMSLLVTPQQSPHVRPLASDFRIVPHIEFDGNEEDNFSSTSLHLRFTKWRRPLNTTSRGTIDEDLFYVESVVSVHDSGKWVCDLDVQRASKAAKKCLWQPVCVCDGEGDAAEMISIDTWEELLDPPDALGIVRAKENSPARLATLALRCQTGFRKQTFVIPVGVEICAKCLADEYLHETGEDHGIIIN